MVGSETSIPLKWNSKMRYELDDHKLIFPDEWFLGSKDTDRLDNLGYIEPNSPEYFDDGAIKKKERRVGNWAERGVPRFSRNPSTGTLDNTPQEGFEVIGWKGRYTTDNKVFRVRDPRGLAFEVYTANVFYLIQNTEIDHGEIQEELIWIYDVDSQVPRLVIEGGDLHQEAKEFTDQRKSFEQGADPSVGDVSRGDEIVLYDDGEYLEATYYGLFTFGTIDHNDFNWVRRFHVYLPHDWENLNEDAGFRTKSSPDVKKILSKGDLSGEEAEEKLIDIHRSNDIKFHFYNSRNKGLTRNVEMAVFSHRKFEEGDLKSISGEKIEFERNGRSWTQSYWMEGDRNVSRGKIPRSYL